MNQKKRIYLAGCTDLDWWREYIRNDISKQYEDYFEFVDPVLNSKNLLSEKFHINQLDLISKKLIPTYEMKEAIVEADKTLIDSCDILVACINKFTVGTIMEIMYTFNQNKPIYIINSGLTFVNDVWLSYHTKNFFESTRDCFKELKDEIFK